jgi:hypothetical protein
MGATRLRLEGVLGYVDYTPTQKKRQEAKSLVCTQILEDN